VLCCQVGNGAEAHRAGALVACSHADAAGQLRCTLTADDQCSSGRTNPQTLLQRHAVLCFKALCAVLCRVCMAAPTPESSRG
jgi:hypothetical protein